MNERIDLAYLIWHWSGPGGAYDVNMRRGRYEAVRRDDGSLLRADNAPALLAEIRADYAARPVPRDRDVPKEVDQ